MAARAQLEQMRGARPALPPGVVMRGMPGQAGPIGPGGPESANGSGNLPGTGQYL
jgi:hypothetical protein